MYIPTKLMWQKKEVSVPDTPFFTPGYTHKYVAPCLRLAVEAARRDSAPGQSLAREMGVDG